MRCLSRRPDKSEANGRTLHTLEIICMESAYDFNEVTVALNDLYKSGLVAKAFKPNPPFCDVTIYRLSRKGSEYCESHNIQ